MLQCTQTLRGTLLWPCDKHSVRQTKYSAEPRDPTVTRIDFPPDRLGAAGLRSALLNVEVQWGLHVCCSPSPQRSFVFSPVFTVPPSKLVPQSVSLCHRTRRTSPAVQIRRRTHVVVVLRDKYFRNSSNGAEHDCVSQRW